MVFLDVVYNHFGPEGNYLGRYAPSFFTEAHTPWGSAIDYRVPEVRAFAIENALHWLRDYCFDGLRLDAVNSILQPRGLSLLHDLRASARPLAVVRLHLPRRNVEVSRRSARRAQRIAVSDGVHQFPRESRPDRQSPARRPSRIRRPRRGDRSGAGGDAAGARDPDAVHGRGMGFEDTLPVLLRFQGRLGRGRPPGPPQR